MSEKVLELSSVVNVLSRTVADLEKQRQHNETRMAVLSALLQSVAASLTSEQRAEVVRSFAAAGEDLMALSTKFGRAALEKEIDEALSRLR